MNSRSFGKPYEFIKQFCRACKNYIKLNNEGKYMCDADITIYYLLYNKYNPKRCFQYLEPITFLTGVENYNHLF